jgi:hypothetical protein
VNADSLDDARLQEVDERLALIGLAVAARGKTGSKHEQRGKTRRAATENGHDEAPPCRRIAGIAP